MATASIIVNSALRALGVDGSLNNPQMRAIVDDIIYNEAIAFCLSQSEWNFGIRDASIASTTTPGFGYTYGIPKPADWVRTVTLSSFAGFVPPLGDYVDQVSRWQTNVTPTYVKYISNDTAYGGNLAIWPASFQKFVELELAWRCSPRVEITDANRDKLIADLAAARTAALMNDVSAV